MATVRCRTLCGGTLRIFLAGATGVIGLRLVPLLVDAGHEVTGMTRSPGRTASLVDAGATAVVCDIFERQALVEAVERSQAELVMHQATDLPDDASRIGEFAASHNRVRTEGTENLITAAMSAGVHHFLAQSVAWELPGDRGAAVIDLERMVLAYPGVVIRYGQFYGPDTYYPTEPPLPPRIQIDEAARRTVEVLDADPGVVTLVDA